MLRALEIAWAVMVALLVLAWVLPRPACAETWAVASVRSYHIERNGQNERNLGLGAERSFGESWRAIGGFYENSSSDTSLYAGAVYAPWRAGAARAGVLAAAVSGYHDSGDAMLAGVYMLEGRRAGLNLGFIPAAGGVFFLQLKLRLD